MYPFWVDLGRRFSYLKGGNSASTLGWRGQSHPSWSGIGSKWECTIVFPWLKLLRSYRASSSEMGLHLLLFGLATFLVGTLSLLLFVFAASEWPSLCCRSANARSGGGKDRLIAETVQACASLHVEPPDGLHFDEPDRSLWKVWLIVDHCFHVESHLFFLVVVVVVMVVAFFFALVLVPQSVSICRSAILVVLPKCCHRHHLDKCKFGYPHRIRSYACRQAADSHPTQTWAAEREKEMS